MGQVSKNWNEEELFQEECFRSFVKTGDFLEFSLQLQQNPKEMISPIDIGAHFPESRAHLSLRGKGLLFIIPKKDVHCDNTLLISAGIHGNETAPIEIVRDQLKDILLGQLPLSIPSFFVLGNLEAMILAHRQVEENLNRLFYTSQAKTQLKPRSLEAIRALEIQKEVDFFVKNFSQNKTFIHYDLHTAIRRSKIEKFAVHPFVADRSYDQAQFFFLKMMGVEAVLFSRAQTTTFSCYTANEYQAESFTVELGMVAKFGQNNLKNFHAADTALRQIYTKGHSKESSSEQVPLSFDVVRTLVRRQEKFRLLFPEDLPNFSTFPKGTPLMEDGAEVISSQDSTEAIVFPNSKVGIGERVALIVKSRH